TWADVDADGRPDLVVGTGRGGKVSLLRNLGGGRFARSTIGASAQGDITTILPVPDAHGVTLVAGQSNYEARSPAEALAIPRVVALNPRDPSRAAAPVFAGDSATVGPLALGDVNGDGRLDL